MAEIKKRRSIFFYIRNFFVQTFRRHSGSEYSEFMTRGVRRDDKPNGQYPWVYIRLFAVLFILFAVFLLIIRFTANELYSPTVMMFAALTFNLPFLVLLYELYPKTDVSLISLTGFLLIGGTCANVIVQVLYSLFPTHDKWISAVYAGFFEELAKGAVAVFIIVAYKRKNPFIGFMIGAAVGCSFSAVEDMGYIFVLSNDLPAINLTTLIQLFVTRGLSSLCTHIVWTGLIGWAYSFFDRHISNVCFYLMLLLSCGLHICWDLPLTGVWYYLVISALVIVSAVAGIAVLADSRKRALSNASDEQLAIPVAQDAKAERKARGYKYYSHAGHLSVVIGVFLMSVIAVAYCAVPFRETYYQQTFNSAEKFVAFMQNDYDVKVNRDRAFDKSESADNFETTTRDDEVVVITQRERDGGYDYFYVYNAVGGEIYVLTDISVEITIDGITSRYFAEDIYNDGEIFASYFRIRGDVTGYLFTTGGRIAAICYNASFVRDLSNPRYMILFYVFGGITFIASVCYIGFIIKSWRVKKNDGK